MRKCSEPFDYIRTEARGPVTWLLYDSPPRNAWGWEMLEAHAETLRQLSGDDSCRVIVLASAVPGYYSVGADLAVFNGFTADDMARWVDLCHATVRTILEAPKPVIAAINGVAVGGGLEFTYHADIRFAASDARLGQPEISIGFIPPCGATVALSKLIGRGRAMRFLYDGALHTASDALELGIVDELVETSRLHEHVQAYAAGLAEKSADGLAAIRQTINAAQWAGFDEAMAAEKAEAVRLSQTDAFKTGVEAFLKKNR
ncbi:MAG: enoyl-CoA hydratase/isomerase family protein [Pseudomonadota bacterium]